MRNECLAQGQNTRVDPDPWKQFDLSLHCLVILSRPNLLDKMKALLYLALKVLNFMSLILHMHISAVQISWIKVEA